MEMKDIWDFVVKYYPNYHFCDDILYAGYLSVIVNKEYQDGSGAQELLIKDYEGNEDHPQIQIDYDNIHRDIYERSIEGYLQSLKTE